MENRLNDLRFLGFYSTKYYKIIFKNYFLKYFLNKTGFGL